MIGEHSSLGKHALTHKQAALAGGVVSGIAGLLTFLVVHALWILPIWFILPLGLVIAIPGGLAAGQAFDEVCHRLPPRPWAAFVFTALIAAILLPATVLAELRPPMFALTTAGPIFQMKVSMAVAVFLAELLLTATLTGGLLGWWLGRTRKAALSMALTGLTFALGPGHNIPFIGGTGGVGKEWAIMGMVIFTSALALVEGRASWLRIATKGFTDERLVES
jgi:hypothetical protein